MRTLVRTSRRGTRLNCWNTIAQRARHTDRSRPLSAHTSPPGASSLRMRPLVGSTSRLIMRSSVDLPAPERPMMPSICPRGTSNVRSSTATSDPNVWSGARPSASSFPFGGARARTRANFCQDRRRVKRTKIHARDHHRRRPRPPAHADHRERAQVLRRDPRQAHPRLDARRARAPAASTDICFIGGYQIDAVERDVPAVHLPPQRATGRTTTSSCR